MSPYTLIVAALLIASLGLVVAVLALLVYETGLAVSDLRYRWREHRRKPPRFDPYPHRPDRNPLHDYMWPECPLPLPHSHALGVFTREED